MRLPEAVRTGDNKDIDLSGSPMPEFPTQAPSGTTPSRAASLGDLLAPEHAIGVTFLFETRQPRFRSALGLSVLTHVLLFAAAVFVAQNFPATTGSTPLLPDLRSYGIVWLPSSGPGGGGGGGGNKSPEPPRKVELPGKDKLTVPVDKSDRLDSAKPKDEPKPEQLLSIPAMTQASSDEMLTGILESLSSETPTSLGLGSGGGAGTGTGTGMGPGQGSGLGPGWGGGTGGGAYRPGNGVEPPRLLREVRPQYTADAMRAKVQGIVWLECIVLPDGTVGDVRVVRSLDPTFGLDQEAVKAAKQWRFIAGTRFGQPVSVIVSIELTFTLR